MLTKRGLAALSNRGLRALGGELVSNFEIARLRDAWSRRGRGTDDPLPVPSLPDGALDYLREDNPRLLELRRRYAEMKHDATARSLWSAQHVTGIDLQRFRADSAFVWQARTDDLREVNYALTFSHLRNTDRLGLLDRLDEDGLFGAVTFDIDGKRMSRDLLDVVAELSFLEETLEISERHGTVLDIGAGYGRLAYGLARAFPERLRVLCTDAVPEATFLSEYYLRFRGADGVARAVALDELEAALEKTPVFLASNVHSFSEIPLRAIRWWVALLSRHRVRYVMVVPNADAAGGIRLQSTEPDGEALDWGNVLDEHGYRLLMLRPKYVLPSVQRHGLSPTHYHLYEWCGSDHR
jgi:SAM-dependent methyltransferase